MSLLLKVLLGVLAFLIATYLAIVAGLLFELWPTTLDDHPLELTSENLQKLNALRERPKFVADQDMMYSGVPNERDRLRAESILNNMIDRLIAGVRQSPRKSFVMRAFKDALREFTEFDTEEQERMGRYLNEVMDILEIESSNKLIMVWRYKFPL